MHIVVHGKDTTLEKSPKIVVLSINTSGAIKVVNEHNLEAQASNVFIDQADSSNDKYARYIV